MEREVLLSVRDLGKVFNTSGRTVRALDGVSFDIIEGEIFGLVGESGSGKSTTGRIISGIYEPDCGEVYFDGELIRCGTHEPQRRIRELSRAARVEKIRKGCEMLLHPRRAEEIRENTKDANTDLQNALKIERERLGLATAARRKYGSGAHPGIRMVFQDPSASLNPRMTVGESVAEALLAIGMRERTEISRRVREALSMVGLAASSEARYPSEFSGGQRQRVGIARAIITRPRLLIADEPISALDVSVGAQVINLLKRLAEEMSLSVLFVAHDLSVVRHICDRVGVMHRGRLVELGSAEDIFTDARHPYTRALLSAVPPPDPRMAKALVHLPAPESYPTEGGMVNATGEHWVMNSE